MEIPLNKDKRCNPPKDSIVLVNRWYRDDFATRRRNRPHRTWPDLVEFDWQEWTGDLAWHGGRRAHVNSERIEGIRARARKELTKARARKVKDELALLADAEPSIDSPPETAKLTNSRA